jgi:phenylacetate-CoA ligase
VLHIIESAYIAEVIDPQNGQAVAPGEKGELVLTNLGRVGSPVLRLRTSDVVQSGSGGPCACGTFELALEGGILGRTDDMVVVRGVNVYPTAVEEILRASGDVGEYRVEIHSNNVLTELRIQVEPVPSQQGGPGLAQRLEAALNSAFALRIPVSSVPSGTLPRFEMKAKRWVRV